MQAHTIEVIVPAVAGPSLRQLEAGFKLHYPSTAQLEAFYEQREAEVVALGRQPVITAASLMPLDRLGRFKVASEYWAKCDPGARNSLLQDEHHSVRSAAALTS